MNTSWLDDTDVAEPGMGSWLSSFFKCGKTSCKNSTDQLVEQQNLQSQDALEGSISVAVQAKLYAQCKSVTDPNAAKASAKKILTANSAYSAVTADPAAVDFIVTLVMNDLIAGGKVMTVPGCQVTAPVVTAPVTNSTVQAGSILSSVSPDLLIIGGLGLIAVMLLKD